MGMQMVMKVTLIVASAALALCAIATRQASGADDSAKPSVTIEMRDGFRFITSNGLADHRAGDFPNRHNPNSISPQHYEFRVPLEPKANETATESRGVLFGVALNGVVFDPGTAEWWRDDPSLGWHMEAIGGPRDLGLDQNNAHVQPQGAYHYHGVPTGLIAKAAATKSKQPLLIGWAADGFPIYGPLGYAKADDAKSKVRPLRSSYRLKTGQRPPQPDAPGGKYDGAYTQDWDYVDKSGDLDECNGRYGVTAEFPNGTYYYVVNTDYPFVPRKFRGTPDESFMHHRPPGGPGGPRRGGPGGPGGAGGPDGRRPPPPPR
jgi:hypothetical protein